MKTFFKILLIPLLFFGMEKLIRTQTAGLRIEKTLFDQPANPDWEVECTEECLKVLDQPFYFLGSGVQCYAFIGEDQTTVLKLFKQYHFGLSSTTLKKIRFLPSWIEKIESHRFDRINSIFNSAKIAYSDLSEQTGTFYVNLNSSPKEYPTIILYDKIGIKRTIDLNQCPFLLQKKADLFTSYLKEHPEQKEALLDSFFECLANRRALGIANTDPAIYKNLGILDGKVIEIDIGSFTKDPLCDDEIPRIENWVEKHRPDLLDYFHQKRVTLE